MKVAVPIWNGRVSPVFDTAGRIILAQLGKGVVESREEHDIQREGAGGKISKLKALGASVLICGAISNSLARHVENSGIRLVPWISGDIDEVLEAFTSGGLSGEGFLMPGCRRRRRRRCQDGDRGRANRRKDTGRTHGKGEVV